MLQRKQRQQTLVGTNCTHVVVVISIVLTGRGGGGAGGIDTKRKDTRLGRPDVRVKLMLRYLRHGEKPRYSSTTTVLLAGCLSVRLSVCRPLHQ